MKCNSKAQKSYKDQICIFENFSWWKIEIQEVSLRSESSLAQLDIQNTTRCVVWATEVYLLTVLEAEKSNIKVPGNLVPDESPLLRMQTASFLLCFTWPFFSARTCRKRESFHTFKFEGETNTQFLMVRKECLCNIWKHQESILFCAFWGVESKDKNAIKKIIFKIQCLMNHSSDLKK